MFLVDYTSDYNDPKEVDKRLTDIEGIIADLHERLLVSSKTHFQRKNLIKAIRFQRLQYELNLSNNFETSESERYYQGLENLQ